MPGRELNLLCFDGGGIRGLSSLYILKRLMEAVDPDKPPKPCEYFDMIGGTNTGGIIAIMLGRLKMDVQQCIKAYRTFADKAFQYKQMSLAEEADQIRERFSSEDLKAAIISVLEEQGCDESTLLKDPDSSCKVFVCATSVGTSAPVLLTSYRRDRGSTELYQHAKIWEAARATSATSSFFDPIAIGPSELRFVDGGTGAQNPVRQLWMEAQSLWGSNGLDENIRCVISIGTGVPSVKKFGVNTIEIFHTLKRISIESETTARQFHQEHSNLDDSSRYFRFNVPDGMAEIGLEELSEISTVVASTDYYLESESTYKLVKICAKMLSERNLSRAIVRKQYPLQHDKDVFLALSKSSEWQLEKERGPSYSMFERISDYDPKQTHERYSDEKCQGTTSWVLSHKNFVSWLDNSSYPCLWLSGSIGCGKTVLTTTVIDHLATMAEENGGLVAHFFYSHYEPSWLTASSLFSSYIKQLIGHIAKFAQIWPIEIVSSIKRLYGSQRATPNFNTMIKEIFLPLTQLVSSVTFLVDGLDECELKEVVTVLSTFNAVIEQPGVKVLISGREVLNVTNAIPVSIRINISGDENRDDIGKFIDFRITEKMRERQITRSVDLLDQIKVTLYQEAKQMILWVKLQIDVLWEECFTDADIKNALQNLPKDLDETYQRCLNRLNKHHQRYAPRILSWISVAAKPFTMNQLCEALAIDMETGLLIPDEIPLPYWVLQCGSNLLTWDKDDQVVLAHHSVRQFLQQSTEAKSILFDAPNSMLKLGELCVAHLTSDAYRRSLQYTRETKGTPIQLDENYADSLWRPIPNIFQFLRPNRAKAKMVFRRPVARGSGGSNTSLHAFFSFAKANWAPLTHEITPESALWSHFTTLALEPNRTWRLHPWESTGSSDETHYFDLLGWATANSHLPILQALKAMKVKKEIYNLPLPHYDGLLPLHLASKVGNYHIVNMLLDLCDIRKRDNHRQTALHHAIKEGHTQLIEPLSALLEEQDADGKTVLHIAAENGNHIAVSKLLTMNPRLATIKTSLKRTVLMYAVIQGWTAVVELLLLLPANRLLFTAEDSQGKSAMAFAVYEGRSEIFSLLLAYPTANDCLEWRERYSKCRLIDIAAITNSVEILKILISRNPEALNSTSSRPNLTPLLWAVMENANAAVELLLSISNIHDDLEAYDRDIQKFRSNLQGFRQGILYDFPNTNLVPINFKDATGYSALAYAVTEGLNVIVEYFLSRSDADVNWRSSRGDTLLSLAIDKSREYVVMLLLKRNDMTLDYPENLKPLIEVMRFGLNRTVEHFLTRKDLRINDRDAHGITALEMALMKKDENIIQQLLSYEGIDVNLPNSAGYTPLFTAVQSSYEAVVRLLLDDSRVDPTLSANNGETPLLCASERSDEEMLELLLTKHSSKDIIRDEKRNTALHRAVLSDNQSGVKILAKSQYGYINSLNAQGHTPLQVALRQSNEKICLELLINTDLTVRHADAKGNNLVHFAARNSNAAVIKLLLELHEIDLDSKNSGGHTALHVAARYGNVEVAKLLLAHGCAVKIWNDDFCSPLEEAIVSNHILTINLLLLRSGLDRDSNDSEELTRLIVAASKTKLDVFMQLLDYADLNMKNGVGNTALHFIVGRMGVETHLMLPLLFREELNVNQKNLRGETPLYMAVLKNLPEFVDFFLKRDDVDVTAADSWGVTPVRLAKSCGQQKILEKLEAYQRQKTTPQQTKKLTLNPMRLRDRVHD